MKIKTQHDRVISSKEKMVLENLVNIASFCPGVILSDARKRKGLNQLLCNDPRANEFVKLDCEIYIDQGDKDVKKFGDAILDWVVSLCDLIRYMHNDLNFTVIPSGSFPLNVKVENLNEFDYSLAWENKSGVAKIQEFFDKACNFRQGEKISSALLDVLKLVLIKSKENMNLPDIHLMEKEHAINIHFSWLCSSNHKHSVSIDLAISIKTSSTIQEYFSHVRCDLKETPFEDSIDINEKMYWNCSVSGGYGRGDTNVFDKQIFETCDAISPNIRLCFRILKFIRDRFLPGGIGTKYCYLACCHVNYFKSSFSSYSLKQVLFREVIEFPSSDHWKNCFIYIRIASMLQKLLKYYPESDIFDTRNKNSALHDITNAFTSILINMIEWLYNGCERISVPRKSMLSVCNKGITVLLENKMLVSVPKRLLGTYEILDLLLDSQIIMFNPFGPLVFQNQISSGLYGVLNDDVESMENVDLTSFSDEDASQIVFMLRFFIITKKEVDSNNYSKKLCSFKEMLLMYRLSFSDIFNMFKKLERYYSINSTDVSLYKTMKEKMPSIFISLEAIFTCITWEERGYIFRSLDYPYGRYKEGEVSRTMKQLSDKVIDLFINSPREYRGCWGRRQTLWILVSINTVEKLKQRFAQTQ